MIEIDSFLVIAEYLFDEGEPFKIWLRTILKKWIGNISQWHILSKKTNIHREKVGRKKKG